MKLPKPNQTAQELALDHIKFQGRVARIAAISDETIYLEIGVDINEIAPRYDDVWDIEVARR